MSARGILVAGGALIAVALVLSPTLHLPTDWPPQDLPAALRFLGRLAGLLGFGAYTIALVLISRWRWLEKFLGGLPSMYQLHHVVGSLAFLALLLHPVFLTSARMIPAAQGGAAFLFDFQDPVVLSGWASLLLLMFFMSMTFLIKLPYHVWRWSHAFSGCSYLLGVYHTVLSFSAGRHLLHGLLLIGFVGLGAYLYYEVWRRLFQKRHEYTVTSVQRLTANVLSAKLSPVSRPLAFSPGQFAYVSFHPSEEEKRRCGITREAHPFSLASQPLSPTLELIVKGVGDYTRQLVEGIGIGLSAQVEGPYGRLLEAEPMRDRTAWIAGGVGIAPFLSGVRAAAHGGMNLPVDLHYWVNDRSEGLYVRELEEAAACLPGFRFFLYESSTSGLPSLATMEKTAGPMPADLNFVLCGPRPMRHKIISELRSRGVPSNQIKTEEFNLK